MKIVCEGRGLALERPREIGGAKEGDCDVAPVRGRNGTEAMGAAKFLHGGGVFVSGDVWMAELVTGTRGNDPRFALVYVRGSSVRVADWKQAGRERVASGGGRGYA